MQEDGEGEDRMREEGDDARGERASERERERERERREGGVNKKEKEEHSGKGGLGGRKR